MLGQIWGVLKFLMELWNQLKIFVGMVEKAKHESAKNDIKEQTDVLKDPTSTEQERLDALKKLQDRLNSRT